jgi:hypothetical protein
MSKKATQKCNSSKFKRMNYFHGMLLTEQDFVDEQIYLREKLKLHNQLHGAGVVWGLRLKKKSVEVKAEQPPGAKKAITKIFIEAGLALDCAGNEIIVCQDFLVPLDEKIEELRRYGLLKREIDMLPPMCVGPKLYVGIRYCECKSNPAEQYTSECADDRLRPQYSRVREGFEVQLFTADELPGCPKDNCYESRDDCSHTCTGCEGLHACTEEEQVIILGTLENYDASTDNPDHKDAEITNNGHYPRTPAYLRKSMWAYRSWEVSRLDLLRHVSRKSDWVDVSVFIGEGTARIDERLREKGLNLGQTYNSAEIADLQAFIAKAQSARPWAAPESNIDVVTDKSGSCIVFLFVNPPRIGA